MNGNLIGQFQKKKDILFLPYMQMAIKTFKGYLQQE